jgi:hypothetical protein
MTKKSEDADPPWADPSPIDHGGRVELRLVESESGTARYAARWYTPEERLDGEVTVVHPSSQTDAPSTTVEIDSPAHLPEWLGSFTTSLVRTTARTAEQKGTWPRRITRWRKSPHD